MLMATMEHLSISEPMEALESGGNTILVEEGSLEVPVVENMVDSLELSGNLTALQAQVLLEDACHFRTIHHKLDGSSLRLYRLYHSLPVQLLLDFTLMLIHCLAFLEWPSSLSVNADLRLPKDRRIRVPCFATQTIEIVCLLILVLDCACKTYFFGQKRTFRSPWLLCYMATLAVSLLDWAVSTSLLCGVFRLRRFLRPLFLLQHSSLMKKTIKCLRTSVAEVFSVLAFLAVLIYMFALVGMCIFPNVPHYTPPAPTTGLALAGATAAQPEMWLDDADGNATEPPDNVTSTWPPSTTTTASPASVEAKAYFKNFGKTLFSLLVLLTTANHPDIMMPIYNQNRFSAIFFIIYIIVGGLCLLNMLTAVYFNQFRGYFQTSIQTQLFRRRVGFRAAYAVLVAGRQDLVSSICSDPAGELNGDDDGVPVQVLRRLVPGLRIPVWKREMIMVELRSRTGCVLDYAQFHEVMATMDETTRPQIELQMPRRRGRVARLMQKVFVSPWFDRFGMLVCASNIIVITAEVAIRYSIVMDSQNLELEYINAVFIAFYLVEQICKVWANGFARIVANRWSVFDLFLTAVLVMMELVQVVLTYTGDNPPAPDVMGLSFWDGARIVNLLIVIRFLRIVPRIDSIRLVASTIRDLAQNFKSFAGVLVAAYYIFALLGMELFGDKIKYGDLLVNHTSHFNCGSYAQLEYWSNNFDDFAASLVTLWEVMIVNNWYVIVEAYAIAVGQWSRVFFVAWWFVAVLVILNLLIALIIENFIQRWDKNITRGGTDEDRRGLFQSMSLYAMFKASLQEPSLEELLAEIKKHPYFADIGPEAVS